MGLKPEAVFATRKRRSTQDEVLMKAILALLLLFLFPTVASADQDKYVAVTTVNEWIASGPFNKEECDSFNFVIFQALVKSLNEGVSLVPVGQVGSGVYQYAEKGKRSDLIIVKCVKFFESDKKSTP